MQGGDAAAGGSSRGGGDTAAGGSSQGAKGAADGHPNSDFFLLVQEKHKQRVDSLLRLHQSVVRILEKSPDKRTKTVVGTGTAFLVFVGEKRSLYLTCDHNFEDKDKIASTKKDVNKYLFIRYCNEETDYQARLHFRDEDRDLALLSVPNSDKSSKEQCLEFSKEELEESDEVGLLGYASPELLIFNRLVQKCLVNVPSPFLGSIKLGPSQAPFPYESSKLGDQDMEMYYFETITTNCKPSRGVSGAPVLKEGRVIGVHLAADNTWREAVTTNTVEQVMRGWIYEKQAENSEYPCGTIPDFLQQLSIIIEKEEDERAAKEDEKKVTRGSTKEDANEAKRSGSRRLTRSMRGMA